VTAGAIGHAFTDVGRLRAFLTSFAAL
jgi:hypothetical protein